MKQKQKDIKELLPLGRPTLYKPEYCDQIIEYFSVKPYIEIERVNQKTEVAFVERVANPLPTLPGFAVLIGVHLATLTNWTKVRPEFSEAVKRAKTMAEHMLVTNGLLGLYDARYAAFIAKNYTGLRDVQEVRDVTDENLLADTPEEIERRLAALDKEIEDLMAQL